MSARPVTHGDRAPSIARAAASGPRAVPGSPGPITHSQPAAAVTAPPPALYQPKWAPRQIHVAHHARHRAPGPASSQPAPRRSANSHSRRAHVPRRVYRRALMLLNHAVLDMQAAGAGRPLLDFMNQPQNLVSTPLDLPKPLANATRIQVFNSYAGIAQALATHRIAADTKAVVYDNERSTGTPAAELADPVRYCRMTAELLHRSGLDYIASPGFDLSGPRPANGEWFRQFVRAGLMMCARHADYLDIQDQLAQGTSIYADDAQAAAGLLRQINPRAKLLMGLSTSPSGRLDAASRLWRAYRDTSQFVNGYWLNVPHNDSGHSRPSVALQLLQKVLTLARGSRGR